MKKILLLIFTVFAFADELKFLNYTDEADKAWKFSEFARQCFTFPDFKKPKNCDRFDEFLHNLIINCENEKSGDCYAVSSVYHANYKKEANYLEKALKFAKKTCELKNYLGCVKAETISVQLFYDSFDKKEKEKYLKMEKYFSKQACENGYKPSCKGGIFYKDYEKQEAQISNKKYFVYAAIFLLVVYFILKKKRF